MPFVREIGISKISVIQGEESFGDLCLGKVGPMKRSVRKKDTTRNIAKYVSGVL